LLHWEEHRAQTVIDHLIEHGIPPEPPRVSTVPRVRTVSMATLALKQVMAK